MASGDIVAVIDRESPPAANAATPDARTGGSTPGELIPVWDFDAGSIEYLDFLCRRKGSGSIGFDVSWDWSASSATANETRWGAAIRRIQDDADDVDASHTYDFNDVDDTAPSASGERSRVTVSFTDGTDMDDLADGEAFILRIRRNATHANDDMSGDAEMWSGTLLIEES